MKRILTNFTLCVTMGVLLFLPAALGQTKAATKGKKSPEHVAAVKKCDEDYKAALKLAKAKKGKERQDAMADAKKVHHDCVAQAPK